MKQDYDLELLLGLDGASYEAAAGYIVEFTVQQTDKTSERPHGINYAPRLPLKVRRKTLYQV